MSQRSNLRNTCLALDNRARELVIYWPHFAVPHCHPAYVELQQIRILRTYVDRLLVADDLTDGGAR